MLAHNFRGNMYVDNAGGLKKNRVPKVEKSNYDVDMPDNSNLKYHIDSGCSNHMT